VMTFTVCILDQVKTGTEGKHLVGCFRNKMWFGLFHAFKYAFYYPFFVFYWVLQFLNKNFG
jgi:hypothetical protein